VNGEEEREGEGNDGEKWRVEARSDVM